jgi:hypothetical protein
MKKKAVKKLVLAKETVRNLGEMGLGYAAAGSNLPCPTDATMCSCAFSQCCESKLMHCFSPPPGN